MADEQKTKDAHTTLFENGIKMRYQVAGKEYVDKAIANGSSDFARPMQEVHSFFFYLPTIFLPIHLLYCDPVSVSIFPFPTPHYLPPVSCLPVFSSTLLFYPLLSPRSFIDLPSSYVTQSSVKLKRTKH